jgi:hypothetical protein
MKSDKIKNWPAKERPRERLIAEGAERLTDAELLAIILRVGRGTFTEGVLGQRDKIFRVVFRADSAIEPEYLAEVMKIPQVRRQIEAAATGTSATMQNITKPSLLALSFPLPPLSVQRQILREILTGRAEIAREQETAHRLAREINVEVEAMILGTKEVRTP